MVSVTSTTMNLGHMYPSIKRSKLYKISWSLTRTYVPTETKPFKWMQTHICSHYIWGLRDTFKAFSESSSHEVEEILQCSKDRTNYELSGMLHLCGVESLVEWNFWLVKNWVHLWSNGRLRRTLAICTIRWSCTSGMNQR